MFTWEQNGLLETLQKHIAPLQKSGSPPKPKMMMDRRDR
jgi:hypothetical protein